MRLKEETIGVIVAERVRQLRCRAAANVMGRVATAAEHRVTHAEQIGVRRRAKVVAQRTARNVDRRGSSLEEAYKKQL